jgi:hypothetical protein
MQRTWHVPSTPRHKGPGETSVVELRPSEAVPLHRQLRTDAIQCRHSVNKLSTEW